MKIIIDSKAKGLIFDMDGTLADSMPIHFKAWKLTAEENGFKYTHKQFLETAGMPTLKIVPAINKELGLNLDPENFSRRKEELFLENIRDVKLIEPVADIVKEYYNKLPMAIGTGGKKEIAKLIKEATATMQLYSFCLFYTNLLSFDHHSCRRLKLQIHLYNITSTRNTK